MKRRELLSYSKLMTLSLLPVFSKSIANESKQKNDQNLESFYFEKEDQNYQLFKIYENEDAPCRTNCILKKEDFLSFGKKPIFYFPFHQQQIDTNYFSVFSSFESANKIGFYEILLDSYNENDTYKLVYEMSESQFEDLGFHKNNLIVTGLNDLSPDYSHPYLVRGKEKLFIMAFHKSKNKFEKISESLNFYESFGIHLDDPQVNITSVLSDALGVNENTFFVESVHFGHLFFAVMPDTFEIKSIVRLENGTIFQNDSGDKWVYTNHSSQFIKDVFLQTMNVFLSDKKEKLILFLSCNNDLVALKSVFENDHYEMKLVCIQKNGTPFFNSNHFWKGVGTENYHGKLFNVLESLSLENSEMLLYHNAENLLGVTLSQIENRVCFQSVEISCDLDFQNQVRIFRDQWNLFVFNSKKKVGEKYTKSLFRNSFLRDKNLKNNLPVDLRYRFFASFSDDENSYFYSVTLNNEPNHFNFSINSFKNSPFQKMSLSFSRIQEDGSLIQNDKSFLNLKPQKKYRKDFYYQGNSYHCDKPIEVYSDENDGEYEPTSGTCSGAPNADILSCRTRDNSQTVCKRPSEDHSGGWNPWWDWRSVGILIGALYFLYFCISTLIYRYNNEEGWWRSMWETIKDSVLWPKYLYRAVRGAVPVTLEA